MNASQESAGPEEHGAQAREEQVSIWEVLAVFVRRRRGITGLSVLAGILAVAIGFVLPQVWEVEATFRPQGADVGLGQLSSLASQFGVNLPGKGEVDSPQFYQELVHSRTILDRVAQRSFAGVLDSSARLHEILALEDPDPGVLQANAIKWLRDEAIVATVGRETGIISLTVKTRWPQLSFQLAEAVLEEVDRFNSETRRSRAAAERAFAEQRREAVRTDLLKAEGELRAFLVENRSFDNSPALRFEHDRLQREVQMRQQIYTSLSQAYEEARISEVRDTPVITVLQAPYVPPEPEGRGLLLKLVMGVVLGGMLGVVMALVAELGAPSRPEVQGAYEEVREFFAAIRSGRVRDFI